MKDLLRLDIKPSEIDVPMDQLETGVRSIQMTGVQWGSSQLVEMCYGIHKLVIDVIIDDQMDQDKIIDQIERLNHIQNVNVVTRYRCPKCVGFA